jgi:choline dehydrogenase
MVGTHLGPHGLLTIRGGTTADRVLFDGTAATGVVTLDGQVLRAGEVILSAGTYGSAGS